MVAMLSVSVKIYYQAMKYEMHGIWYEIIRSYTAHAFYTFINYVLWSIIHCLCCLLFHLGHTRGPAGSSLATGYTKSECLLRTMYLCSAHQNCSTTWFAVLYTWKVGKHYFFLHFFKYFAQYSTSFFVVSLQFKAKSNIAQKSLYAPLFILSFFKHFAVYHSRKPF